MTTRSTPAAPGARAGWTSSPDAERSEASCTDLFGREGASVPTVAQGTPSGRRADLPDPTGAPFALHATTPENPPPAD